MKLSNQFGLGDLAHWVFRPFAYAIDAFWGTDLKHCEKCAERQAKWNALFSMPQWQWVVDAAVVAGILIFCLTIVF